EYLYTNSGFFLLGQIVERVSGRSLNEFAQEHVFEPLGMTKTLFLDDHNRIIKDRATGYVEGKDGFRVCMSNWEQTGDGSVCTTVGDLYLWDQAFYSNSLGKDVMDMLQTRGALNSGKTIDYAWGLYVSEYKGLKIVRHSGSWAGFRAAMVRFPEQRFSVIVLANLESISPSALAYSIADIYLAGLLKEPPEEEPGQGETGAAAKGGSEVTVAPFKAPSPAELSAYAGTYVGEELLDARYIIGVAKDGLVLKTRTEPQAALEATAPDKFVAPGSGLNIEFVRDRRGKVMGFELGLDRAIGILFKRVTR
ncbi:MAG TPA: serine hydrolase domain-containing protein, partial [Acidobacteriota bacterium]|nr:serine hydrolase domain-containing protein [Acidobacteriota bacterium]